MEEKMKGREAFLKLLLDEGVTHFFGNPGTTELPIIEALQEYPDLKYVLGLQEAVVVAMADGFSRSSGRLSACNLHCAPGLGNAMGAIYNAKFSGSPIIITAGQYEIGYGLTEPLLYEPLVPIATPLVKWAVEVQRVEDLPRIVRRAAKIAMTPPMGPVFISLPGSVLNAEAVLHLGAPTRLRNAVRPAQADLEEICRRIAQADNPVIIAGRELEQHGAFAAAAQFAECLGAPVYLEPVPYNTRFPSTHALAMGDIGRNQPRVREALSHHDLLICLGGDLLRMSPYHPIDPMPPGLAVIHISERDWELGKNYATGWAVQANVKSTLSELNRMLPDFLEAAHQGQARERTERISKSNWRAQRQAEIQRIESLEKRDTIQFDQLMLGICKYVSPDAIIVEESLTTAATLARLLETSSENRYYGLASGGLGFGLPGALGVALANPARPVVAIIGDGSSMYGIQALWSAAHLKLNVTFIIVNNRSYRILKDRMPPGTAPTGFIGMDFNDPEMHFSLLAAGLGIAAEKIDSHAELAAFLESSLNSSGPRLVEVVVQNGY